MVTGSVAALLPLAILVLGSASTARADNGSWVRQVGTYDALVAPDYDGNLTIDAVLSRTALGLGTLDHLDGELVVIGGSAYRVGVDGRPAEIAGTSLSPFAQAIAFSPDASGPIPPGTTCAGLASLVDDLAGTSQGIIAVRVRGTFTDLVTRSVAAQSEPYPTLANVVAGQTVFRLGQRRAVLVGFRTGADLAGVGAPGLHLHGITADRSAGGHVLSCTVGPDAQLSIQRATGVQVLGAGPTASRS